MFEDALPSLKLREDQRLSQEQQKQIDQKRDELTNDLRKR